MNISINTGALIILVVMLGSWILVALLLRRTFFKNMEGSYSGIAWMFSLVSSLLVQVLVIMVGRIILVVS